MRQGSREGSKKESKTRHQSIWRPYRVSSGKHEKDARDRKDEVEDSEGEDGLLPAS